MADIFDTLHPQKTPSDNLYPNIKPSQNIPDHSINKSKLGFTLDNDRGYAVIPDNEYIDIAYKGVPGNVYFPAGTRMAYLQDEGLVFSEPMRGHILMGGVGDEKPLIIIWYSITDNTVYVSNVDTTDEASVFISADDFLVMILKRKLGADELNPRVFPLYSILPYDIIKYNTRDYYWVDLQNNFALQDMEYDTLGAGYLCNRVYIQPTTQNWYRIAQINSFVLSDSVYGVISASTYIPISFMQSDKPVSALLFVSLNVRNGTDVSGCKVTMIAGNADINNLRYTVDVDPNQTTCKVTVYVKGVANGFISATELAYTRWDDDEEGVGHSTGEPFFYDEDTGSTTPPASSFIPDVLQGLDDEGNVISETYARQTGSYPNLGAGKDGDGNVISETYAKKSEVGGGGAQQLTNEDLNEMFGAEYWGKDYYADEGNGVMYAPTLNGEAFYLQIRHGGDDFTVQFIAVIDIERLAVRCWHRFISPTMGGSAWIEIATEDSEGGTAYHHHIQATIEFASEPPYTPNYVQVFFTIINTDASPITTLEELYNTLYALPWTTRDTRWTPCTGGVWLDDQSNDWGAWPTVGIRALLGIGDEKQLGVMCYRVGTPKEEGPFKQYTTKITDVFASILDTVTDQYSNYVAGGDV